MVARMKRKTVRKERVLTAERDRADNERDRLRKERDKLKAELAVAKSARLPKAVLKANPERVWATLAEWAAHSPYCDLKEHSFPTNVSTERYVKQVMLGRTVVSCAPGTGFCIVYNPSQSPNAILAAQPGAALSTGSASTSVIYTGITAATDIFGTGSQGLNLAGQYTSTTAEQGSGWNRHLGFEARITQTTTSLIRGAQVYTSRSDKAYSVFTVDQATNTYVGAGIGELITASHTGMEAIDFVSSTESIRIPGKSHEPKPLYPYLARTTKDGGAITTSLPHPELLPASLGAIAPEGWTEYIIVLPYDQTTAIDYIVQTELVNETARFTPNAAAGGFDSVYTVVPNKSWHADPVSVARDNNALAAGISNTTGFKVSPEAVYAALDGVYRLGKFAYGKYRNRRGRIGGPNNIGLIGNGAGAGGSFQEDDGYLLP